MGGCCAPTNVVVFKISFVPGHYSAKLNDVRFYDCVVDPCHIIKGTPYEIAESHEQYGQKALHTLCGTPSWSLLGGVALPLTSYNGQQSLPKRESTEKEG